MVHSGDADAVESFGDEDRFIKWSTVVVPVVICLEGQANFFKWSRMVVPIVAHSSMAKENFFVDLQW